MKPYIIVVLLLLLLIIYIILRLSKSKNNTTDLSPSITTNPKYIKSSSVFEPFAPIKTGDKCKKSGMTSTYTKIKYKCVKIGKKLVWQAMTKVP